MNEEDKIKQKNGVKNPGLVLDLNKKCISVFPVLFDGLRVQIHKPLSSHFKVIHSIYFSSITPGNYRFGAAYAGTKKISDRENSPVFYGDISPTGNLNATMFHLFGSKFKLRFDAQMENRSFVSSQLGAHYLGDSFTASAILSNSDILSKSGCLLLQYLQNVSSSLALGAEYAYLRNLPSFNKNNPYPPRDSVESQFSVMARYTTPRAVWSTVLSKNNILLNCYKQASEQLEFGIEINSNFRIWESVGTLAFKNELIGRGIVFRGFVDTNTNVGSVVEKRFCGSPIAFSVSANLNHKTSNFRLGLGITVEGT